MTTSRPGWSWFLGLAFLLVSTPAAAQQWVFSPFMGWTFAGSTVLPDLEQGARASQWILGGSAGWWSPGILGVETDFAYAPRFFERDVQGGGQVSNSNVVTLGVDVILTTPVSLTRESLRPYLVGGVGWMHASIEDSQNLFPDIFPELLRRARDSAGMNLGGGAVGMLSSRTGVRFELRQFRSLERDEHPFTGERMSLLRFWRATVGVVILR